MREFGRYRASHHFHLSQPSGIPESEQTWLLISIPPRTAVAEVEPAASKPARGQVIHDDRWPDRSPPAMFAFAALVVVSPLIPALRRYFRHYDAISMLTIPIVPNLVYAALLIAMGIAMRRRLRAAWWIFLIWWIILPQLVRIGSLATGGSLLQIVGLAIMTAVLVILWRARPQFQAHGRRKNLLAATACFLVGSAVVLVLGTVVGEQVWGYAGPAYSDAPCPRQDVGRCRTNADRCGPVSNLGHDRVGRTGAAVILASTYLLLQAAAGNPDARTQSTGPGRSEPAALILRVGLAGLLRRLGDKSIVWNTATPQRHAPACRTGWSVG